MDLTDKTLNHNLDAAYAMREALRAKIVECRPAIIGDRFGDGQAYTVRRLLDALDAQWLKTWQDAHADAHARREAPRCTHCQKEPGTLATVHGLFCLACFQDLEADNDGVAADGADPGRGRLGDPASPDAAAVSRGGLRDSGDHSPDRVVPHPGDGDSDPTLTARLEAWSHDERLGDGMLLRKAAARIVSLTYERDNAVEEMAEMTAQRDAAIDSARHAGRRIAELEALVDKLAPPR